MRKVVAIAWSQDGHKVAVANSDRLIYFYDENGQTKDKIMTRG